VSRSEGSFAVDCPDGEHSIIARRDALARCLV
jgi:hypothetical protein